jgi:hypothetical protein
MTKRTFISKSGDTYEWEETPETVKALKELHKLSEKVNERKATD